MKKSYLKSILLECSNYLSEEQHKYFSNTLNNFVDVIEFLDYINLKIFDLKFNGNITENNYKKLLDILDKYYQRENGYSENRINWINELRYHEGEIQLKKHHKILLNYFNLLNKILNDNDIDYFHASGFMCYLLINKKLERYHHDIDLYINIEDINKIKTIFNDNDFKLIHTCEKNDKNILRHGYKIECSLYNIPIWLSFYKKLSDGAIYIQEYYQNTDGHFFTKENYNSPLCCKLSLINHSYNNIPFTSLNLEALYVSKANNRKKDIYDCSVIKDFVNYNYIKTLEKELCNTWNIVERLPKKIENSFFEQNNEEKVYEKKITEKRIKNINNFRL